MLLDQIVIANRVISWVFVMLQNILQPLHEVVTGPGGLILNNLCFTLLAVVKVYKCAADCMKCRLDQYVFFLYGLSVFAVTFCRFLAPFWDRQEVLSTIQHRVRRTTQGLKNLVNALASLLNEATVASSVWYFDLMAQARLDPSKAAFTLFSH